MVLIAVRRVSSEWRRADDRLQYLRHQFSVSQSHSPAVNTPVVYQDVPIPGRSPATATSHDPAGDRGRTQPGPTEAPTRQDVLACSSAICHLTTWRGRYVSAVIDFELKCDRYCFAVTPTTECSLTSLFMVVARQFLTGLGYEAQF